MAESSEQRKAPTMERVLVDEQFGMPLEYIG